MGKSKRKVQVWILCGDQTLLLQTNEKRGAFWQPVTGGVEPGESFHEAAVRELNEETGLSGVPVIDAEYQFEYQNELGNFVEKVFYCFLSIPQAPSLESKEHQAYRWINCKDAAESLRFESNQIALKHVLKKQTKS